MTHQVLSRKYRPQRFADLVGQEAVTRILRGAIAAERVGHAYLFVGPRGVGKTTCARLLARALNCSGRELTAETLEPCGTCPSCVDIAAGNDLDVMEMDAASNNAVDDVRALREQVGYATVRSPYRIWIVDEVHMLSLAAFNAFLKTLEEPPDGVKFIFCTTEEHKLPETFRSRCQRVEFKPVGVSTMAQRLIELAAAEGTTLTEDVATSIADGALGGLRDAESLLEQLLGACAGDEVTLEDLDALVGRAPRAALEQLVARVDEGDPGAALDAADACLATGCKPGVLLDQWLDHLRRSLGTAAREGALDRIPRLSRAVDVLLAKRAHLRGGADGVLITQVAAIELARLPDARDLDKLLGALRGVATPSQGGGGDASGRARPREAGSQAAKPRREGGPSPASSENARPRTAAAGGGAPAVSEVVPPGGTTPAASTPAVSPPAVSPPGRAVAVAEPAPGVETPPEEGMELARIRAGWSTFVGALRHRDKRLATLVDALQAHDITEQHVVLVMPEEIPGARATLARREIQIAFSQVLRDVFGEPRFPRLRERDAIKDVGQMDETLRDHPLVRRVTEFTRGHVLAIERTEASS